MRSVRFLRLLKNAGEYEGLIEHSAFFYAFYYCSCFYFCDFDIHSISINAILSPGRWEEPERFEKCLGDATLMHNWVPSQKEHL